MINKANLLDSDKLVFSGHSTFALRYGWLKKIYDACTSIENNNKNISKDLFNADEAISILGVGKNMVTSMKYWSIYTHILYEDKEKKEFKITQEAHKIYNDKGLDPWLENDATLWKIHREFVTNKRLFTYYWLFNCCNINEFTKENFIEIITYELIKLKESKHIKSIPSQKTLIKDIECCLNLYTLKSKNDFFNIENLDSPLIELGLIANLDHHTFKFKRGKKHNLSINVFLYGLLLFWKDYSPNASTLSLEAICYEKESPGRIFLLDENAIGEYMENLENDSNDLLAWSETSGLKQVLLKNTKIDFTTEATQFLERNYK